MLAPGVRSFCGFRLRRVNKALFYYNRRVTFDLSSEIVLSSKLPRRIYLGSTCCPSATPHFSFFCFFSASTARPARRLPRIRKPSSFWLEGFFLVAGARCQRYLPKLPSAFLTPSARAETSGILSKNDAR